MKKMENLMNKYKICKFNKIKKKKQKEKKKMIKNKVIF